MPEISARSACGVDLGGFHPLLAAGSSWVLASEQKLTVESLDEVLARGFRDQTPSGYVKRFTSYKPRRLSDTSNSVGDFSALIDEAVIESEAALRKILIEARSGAVYREDEDFDADPVYSRASRILEEIQNAAEEISPRECSKCPRCGLVADLLGWFGMRRISGRTIRQSWCRVCRTFRPSHTG